MVQNSAELVKCSFKHSLLTVVFFPVELTLLFLQFLHQFNNQKEFEENFWRKQSEEEKSSIPPEEGSFYERVLISINIVFTVLFTIECILKLLAFGIKV